MPHGVSKLVGCLFVCLFVWSVGRSVMYWQQLSKQWMTQRDRMELATQKSVPWNLHCFYTYWISSKQNNTKRALATNTWNRFQAGCIHYNGKPNISAASILNKISPTDDNELLLQPGGYARDQASNPARQLNSYVHSTIRNSETPLTRGSIGGISRNAITQAKLRFP